MLAVDTATAAVTAGLVEVMPGSAAVRAERVTVDARRHGEELAPAIAACLGEAGARPAELAAVVAGVGPGPFTGLRVGLATVAAVADALTIPAYGVCSLDAVAHAARSAEPNLTAGPLLVAADARRREVYWAVYDPQGLRVHGPEVARPLAVRAWLDAVGEPPTRAAGAGAALYADVLGLPVDGPSYPTVAALGALAADRVRAGAPGEPLTPLYLRRPDAVEPAASRAPVPPR